MNAPLIILSQWYVVRKAEGMKLSPILYGGFKTELEAKMYASPKDKIVLIIDNHLYQYIRINGDWRNIMPIKTLP